MKTNQKKQQLAKKVLQKLKTQFKNVDCTLTHFSPFQLLIATILSAQCTDKRVNQVTPALFSRFPTPLSFKEASLESIEAAIRSTGFYHNKAKNIQLLCCQLLERFDGEVPNKMEDLISLPGVGRKTANVVLGNAFGIKSGFVVDTHVSRLSQRIGLTDQTTPEKIEIDLMEIFPENEWIDMSHRLILLGRENCKAMKPACDLCILSDCCQKRLHFRTKSNNGFPPQ